MHAIVHDSGPAAVAKRVEALRKAVFAVAKKHHVFCGPFTKFADNLEWQAVVAFWESRTPEEVIAIVEGWSERPTYRDVLLASRSK